MTKRTLLLTVTLICAVAVAVVRQDWQGAYDAALKAAADGRWTEAREHFLAAASQRPGDSNKPISLPGPITEPRLWRDGAPYSPSFGAAYSAYRASLTAESAESKNALIDTAERELRALVDSGQVSPEAVRTLAKIYETQGNKQMQQQVLTLPINFSVDQAILALEDRGIAPAGTQPGVQPQGGGIATPGEAPIETGGQIIKVRAGQQENLAGIFGVGPVATLEKKYALVIGNGAYADPAAAIPFAASDAQAVKDALTQYGGYQDDHVTLLADATAGQIRDAVAKMADEIPDDAVVLIYFSGMAAHLGGRDYIAGVDAEFKTDTSKMIEKLEILQPFVAKGAAIYMFSQVDRSMDGTNYYGQERLLRGTVSEAQATVPGGTITSIVSEGRAIGLYTYAFCETLKNFFTNEVPITEFCWHVFYTMRRGNDPRSTGGSVQTPTLPVLTNMSRESRF